MTNSELLEEILHESHSVGLRREVMDRAAEIMGSEDFKRDKVDAYQQAYNELVESRL